jgi:serine protease AprX
MKSCTIALVLIFFQLTLVSQTSSSGPKKYWVQFKDKANSPFSVDAPEEYLSQKAIERRQKQGLALSENDLPVNASYIQQVAVIGARVLYASKWFNSVTIEVSDSTILPTIQALSCVKSTSQVARVKVLSNADLFMQDLMKVYEQAQAKTELTATPGSDPIYGDANLQIKMLEGHKLHAMGFRGKGQTIAVLDAGFFRVNEFALFDSLRTNNRILGTRDFVQGNDSVYEDNSHGLSVLSTMAANVPGIFVGTAPEASYWLIRTEDAGSEFTIEEDNWVRGAEFADSVGVDIINSSLGYTVFDDPSTSHSYQHLNGNTTRITIGADIAASKGILVVNSAGNSGADPWRYLGAPADADSILTIGAVDAEGKYALFSSQGPTSDGRIKPNVTAMGQLTLVATNSGNVGRSNGTSFSSPVIAGMVACLWQAHPTANMMQVFKAIEKSGDQADRPDAYRGFGIPNFMRAHGILSQLEMKVVPKDSIVNVYPNPFIEGVSVEYYSQLEQQITVNIYKNSGKLLASEKFQVFPYVNSQLQLENVRKLKPGNYVVSVVSNSGTHNRQIIKN